MSRGVPWVSGRCPPGPVLEIDGEIGGWGGEIEVERRPPAGKSVSVSCSCRACGRGEAAWAGERNDPAVARAKSRQMSLPPGGVGCPGVSRECPAVSRGCPAGVPPVRCEIDSEIACKIECEIECEIDR